jgi:hypothetical protein
MLVVLSNACHAVAALLIATRRPLLPLFLAMAPLLFCQPGDIAGTVVDASGAAVRGARVKLSLDGRAPDRETQSAESGDFSFPNVIPGPYRLSFTAKGFAPGTVAGELRAGETLNLLPTALAIESLATDVTVTQTQAELAEAQIKVEEQQRLLGVLPNFFAAYDRDAAPLNAQQKLELTARTWFDPSSFVIEGIIAGVWQAQNTHKGFGQGAQGYAKRYGAGFADYGTSLLLEKVVTTTIFKQDPRYFYKGTGTNRSRALYAISRTFVCRGDNRKDQFCYSSFINRFGSGFLTNYYYPAADRDHTGVILRNSALSIGFDALGNLFQEFVARKITRKK